MQKYNSGNFITKSIQTFINNGYALTVLAVTALALPIAYTNCSSEMSFEATSESKQASLNGSGTIVINDGNEYTNNDVVTLSIAHAYAEKMYVTNDPTCETGGTWQPTANKKVWTLGSTNTTSAVFVKFAQDGDEEISGHCLTDSIIHDNIAPELSITQRPNEYTNASTVTALFASSDSGSGVSGAACDVGAGTTASTCAPNQLIVQNPVEGMNSYTVEVRDRAGNVSEPQSVFFVADRTAPSVRFSSQPSAVTNTGLTKFEYSATDSGAGSGSGVDRFECKLDSGSWATCENGLRQFTVSAGSHKFDLRAVDRAGNRSSEISHSWVVDTDAPTVEITEHPAPFSQAKNPTFAFIGTDDGQPLSQFECTLTGSKNFSGSCSSPKQFSDLRDGSYTFTVRAKDAGGNFSSPASYTWTVDTKVPSVTIGTTQSNPANSKVGQFTISAMDENGIQSIECAVDGSFVPCTNAFNTPALADGTHTFQARAKDQAGNVGSSTVYTWKIDTTKPEVNITDGPASWIKVKASGISFTASDSGSGLASVECRVNDQPYKGCISSYALTDLEEGSYVFDLRATDKAGNVSAVASHSWGVDITAPEITISNVPSAVSYGSNVQINIAVSEVGAGRSGVKSIMCGLEGSLKACSSPYSDVISNLSTGNYKYVVEAEDNAGNQSSRSVRFSVTQQTQQMSQTINVPEYSGNDKVDILVVMDNSGSMAEEQKNLSQKFGSFISELSNIDWQLGITTTDVRNTTTLFGNSTTEGAVGRLIAFRDGTTATQRYTIKGSDADASARFSDTITVGIKGSGSEYGIRGTYLSLEKAIGNQDHNGQLIRPDAALAVILISDENETDLNNTQSKPDNLINYVHTSFPNKKFAFHSIIWDSANGCVKDNGAENYGAAYVEMSTKTGGIVGNICANDYSTQLKDIGKATRTLVYSVDLNCAPVDINFDGKPDVTVTGPSGAITDFTVNNKKVSFNNALPVGNVSFAYHCLKN